MEYIILDRGKHDCQYFLLVGQATGEVPYEDYGVKIRRLRDGTTAQREHLARSPAGIQRIIDTLMENNIGPEGLRAPRKRRK